MGHKSGRTVTDQARLGANVNCLRQGSANYDPQAKSGPLPGFMDMVLQEPSCARSSEHLLWLLLHTVEKLHHRLCGPCPWGKKCTKIENYVLFGRLTENLSLGGSLSDSSETLLQRGKGRARIYRNFCNRNQVVRTLRDNCQKGNQACPINEFSTYVWEEVRHWVHWNHPFDMHLHCLEPVSRFSPMWIPLGCIVWWRLQWLKLWWLQYPLFPNKAGVIFHPHLHSLTCLFSGPLQKMFAYPVLAASSWVELTGRAWTCEVFVRKLWGRFRTCWPSISQRDATSSIKKTSAKGRKAGTEVRKLCEPQRGTGAKGTA